LSKIPSEDSTSTLLHYLRKVDAPKQRSTSTDQSLGSYYGSQTPASFANRQDAPSTQQPLPSKDSTEAISSIDRVHHNLWSASLPEKAKQNDPEPTSPSVTNESKELTPEAHMPEKNDERALSPAGKTDGCMTSLVYIVQVTYLCSPYAVVDKRTTYMIRNIPNKYTQVTQWLYHANIHII